MSNAQRAGRKAHNLIWYGAAFAVIAAILCSYLFAGNVNSDHIIAKPKYPGKIGFNDSEERLKRREEIDEEFIDNLKKFSFNSASMILKEEDSKTNALYSPMSLYMALAMMAESAQGSTQEEILKAISMNDMDMIREQTGKLFRKLYFYNEIGRLNLANSLWLNKDIEFNKSFLDKMAADYYAHSFSVDFDDKYTSRKISEWVSEHTGGKLGTDPDDFPIDSEQVMTLLNTVYFYDEWVDSFNADKTAKDTFHLEDGNTISCDFMNMTRGSHRFVGADGYIASGLSFKNGGSMVFILPDEGISSMDMVSDPAILSEAVNSLFSEKRQFGKVIFKIPKFNYKAELDLRKSVESLGIKSVFEAGTADFTPLSETKPIFVSEIKQSAAISIDEKGCEATAFTKIDYVGAARPDGTAEMILDRPFIFAITGADACPLFIGVINNPAA